MRICISIGELATTPYCITGLDIPVFCIEELCYVMRENAVLLDITLINRELVDWINNECRLPELADPLYRQVQRQGRLSDFVGLIQEFVGLYDSATIEEIRKVLKDGTGLSSIERHKRRIDYQVRNGSYAAAVRGYRSLIAKWEQVENDRSSILPAVNVLAEIYHNLGVSYAKMMMYEPAAEAFEFAHKLDGDRSHFVAMLRAKRLLLSDEEYADFITVTPGAYEESIGIESEIAGLDRKWPSSQACVELMRIRLLHDEGKLNAYLERSSNLTESLKKRYRDQAEG